MRNLRKIDAGADLDEEMLHGIYDRLKANEFRPGSDHVTQVNVGWIGQVAVIFVDCST